MARYRKIDVRLWVDQKFSRLSAPPPCGRYLWMYLLTGPETVNVPGLYRAGEAALAEAIGWPMKGFREAFAEVFQEGMAEADWEARVIWIPRAIFYNEPESPNVVKGWRMSWDEIPDCFLKQKAYQSLKAFLKDKGEAFEEAFLKACAQPSPNQEQEQEQEQNKTLMSGSAPDVDPPKARNGHHYLASARSVLQFLNEKTGRRYQPVDANLRLIVARFREGTTEQQLRQVVAKKCREWTGNEKMETYLRPATLFNREKCAQYVGELVNADDSGS